MDLIRTTAIAASTTATILLELHLEALTTNLEAIHGSDSSLCTLGIVVANKA